MAPDTFLRRSQVVLIGGQIGSGKTAAATGLSTAAHARLVPVRSALEQILGGSNWDRRRLQAEGADLDRRTNGRWLLDFLLRLAEEDSRIVVDAARTRRQVEPILEAGIDARLAYLSASESTRRYRYGLAQSTDPVKRSTSFDEAMGHPTESEATTLMAMADVVIETDGLSLSEIVAELRSALSW